MCHVGLPCRYWEDIIDFLEDAGEVGAAIRLGSARYEVVCVDMTWAGNGDRLPPTVDRSLSRD